MHRPKQKRKFSFDQYCALSFGNNFFGHIGPVFETDEDYQVAWLLHRDEVLTSNPGRRPAAWWQLEAPVGLEKPRASGAETILLFERGLLHRGLPLKRKSDRGAAPKTRDRAPCIMRMVRGKQRQQGGKQSDAGAGLL